MLPISLEYYSRPKRNRNNVSAIFFFFFGGGVVFRRYIMAYVKIVNLPNP